MCVCMYTNEYICAYSHTHTYFLVLLLKGPKSNNIPVEINISSAQNLDFIYYHPIKELRACWRNFCFWARAKNLQEESRTTYFMRK